MHLSHHQHISMSAVSRSLILGLKICGERIVFMMKPSTFGCRQTQTLQVLTWCWIWMLQILNKRWCFCGRSCQDIAQINCGSYKRWAMQGMPCSHCATHWDLSCNFSVLILSVFEALLILRSCSVHLTSRKIASAPGEDSSHFGVLEGSIHV